MEVGAVERNQLGMEAAIIFGPEGARGSKMSLEPYEWRNYERWAHLKSYCSKGMKPLPEL